VFTHGFYDGSLQSKLEEHHLDCFADRVQRDDFMSIKKDRKGKKTAQTNGKELKL
jgi:hypothetical protein